MTRAVYAPTAVAAGATIEQVLSGRLVQPLFQPIVDLATRRVIGLEALARGPAGTSLEYPDRLFTAAREAGCLGALDLLCSERALELAIGAPQPPPLLFTNVEPAVLDQPLSPRLIELITGGLPFRQVVEFTERALPAVPGSMLRVAGQTQTWGNGLALDDVGADPMSLAFLPLIEPEVIKLDMSLLRNPGSDHTGAVCAVVRAEAERTGALVIAEGIETADDLATARLLGARWGQGWLFGRPGGIEAAHRYDTAAAGLLRPARPGFHETTENAYDCAAAVAAPTPATADDIAAAMTRLRDVVAAHDTAVVVMSSDDTGLPGIAPPLAELAGRACSVIVVDRPVPGEFVAVAIVPGDGFAVGIRRPDDTPRLVIVDHLPAVAVIARALLNRHR
ncbi:EAL domain-containing protein (putative c-di-GMP-specific phosphodiesterase class I) [Actinoplanes italicus]|uniref:EAL domain-containing protein (Putative c-di-GMP-specific phosphodiesterase class I) n=2 Tax=Actinoplanes italicus TaxID=113567 RepID=A0A2T0KF87_9ACTN|nr:EAL domain-containing protein (putative c-di-GMP-specific phosphodiesterase class I) [Actinoplanes italicus]